MFLIAIFETSVGLSLSIYCWKNLKNAGPLGQKCTFFILLIFDDNEVLFKYFHIFIFCSGRAFHCYINNDNPTLVLDMASENIKCVSNFFDGL